MSHGWRTGVDNRGLTVSRKTRTDEERFREGDVALLPCERLKGHRETGKYAVSNFEHFVILSAGRTLQ